MRDLPFFECVAQADVVIKAGATVFQTYTCRHCDKVQHMNSPNKFFYQGICQHCKQVNDLYVYGCRFEEVKG